MKNILVFLFQETPGSPSAFSSYPVFYQDPKHWGKLRLLGGGRRPSAEGARSSRAEGVEGVGDGKGYPPLQPTRGSGGAS